MSSFQQEDDDEHDMESLEQQLMNEELEAERLRMALERSERSRTSRESYVML